jgi:hypothetical protein
MYGLQQSLWIIEKVDHLLTAVGTASAESAPPEHDCHADDGKHHNHFYIDGTDLASQYRKNPLPPFGSL